MNTPLVSILVPVGGELHVVGHEAVVEGVGVVFRVVAHFCYVVGGLLDVVGVVVAYGV